MNECNSLRDGVELNDQSASIISPHRNELEDGFSRSREDLEPC